MKKTTAYWNPIAPLDLERWEAIEGSEGRLKQLTLAEDPESGDYTRLTWFADGYDTTSFGAKEHTYPEEVFVISGRLHDAAFDLWLEPGTYTSRPPGESHGPFKADGDVLVLEMSYPSQSTAADNVV